jgi:hypothetical protein
LTVPDISFRLGNNPTLLTNLSLYVVVWSPNMIRLQCTRFMDLRHWRPQGLQQIDAWYNFIEEYYYIIHQMSVTGVQSMLNLVLRAICLSWYLCIHPSTCIILHWICYWFFIPTPHQVTWVLYHWTVAWLF